MRKMKNWFGKEAAAPNGCYSHNNNNILNNDNNHHNSSIYPLNIELHSTPDTNEYIQREVQDLMFCLMENMAILCYDNGCEWVSCFVHRSRVRFQISHLKKISIHLNLFTLFILSWYLCCCCCCNAHCVTL